MAAPNLTRLTRNVKKLEKPRPLKILGNSNRLSTIDGRLNSVEDIMALADSVSMHLANANFDQMLRVNIISICNSLKLFGQQLETIYKDQLDRIFVAFRNGCRDERLDYLSRVHLLEAIELRASNWQGCDNLIAYYKAKTSIENQDMLPVPDTPTLLSMASPLLGTSSSPTQSQALLLSSGEIIKTSGKFAKPTKIPGKNYCKDEVVIRNSDSGKVNPGAKERLVQITGPSEEKINHAKQLIEDTIRRNASPIRLEQPDKERMGGSSSSLNSSASDESNRFPGVRRSALLHSFSTNDASLGEYKYTVTVGNHSIKITGTNLDLVRTAKLLLDEHFNQDPEQSIHTSCEDEPKTPSTPLPDAPPGKFSAVSRVDSQDSNATSESDETYKAPLALEPASALSPGIDTTLGKQLAVVRQPLFPDASKEAFEQAEASVTAMDVNARNRRACFAHTNSQQQKEDSAVVMIESESTDARAL
ncbi:eukaryotic translation initiation factor 4E-binding protein Mextli isoform X2 [Zootermopsis nevadensis]|uniref:eukaryotic translation initiation factor 4E-binding protein Mextli isoform X2 n=1 Tax=Zootermopsis nevadensis TaxID=136037 RepID=UPI000B8E40FE|nr:eukaryotic translation initiation factor 4E-binding protein Mextli isoform X2 [Zootermopsis nevadensis]